ncbi:serine hydrolase domain-containing protein [Chengkuizengella axinellae]|uniref:Serine hydrolase domain-containing protein n=1 Tax=Chengkuizengella axinellae TaxID=3064388 RepID=A0ABT9IY83_9BACL|nr:serine hydrolase domain-containing protein [Chengkuizengella sp. 2205SS18-9]MDP5274213.1 serine hydrolase domain-containing protein [Chengkuizengella sp. 2205SS18-9]
MVHKINQYLTDLSERQQFNGAFFISKDGEVVGSGGIGMANFEDHIPNQSNTQYYVGSITKTFTAIAIMMLHEKALLDLHESCERFFPEYEHSNKITIHHLLAHGSGVPNFFDPEDFLDTFTQRMSVEQILDLFIDKPLNFEPGEKSEYSNSNYILLGLIIEKVTGQPYQDYIDQHILKPLNMDQTGFPESATGGGNLAEGYEWVESKLQKIPVIHSTNLYASGEMYSTVQDLALLDQVLYTDKLLMASSIEKMHRSYFDPFGYGCTSGENLNKKYVLFSGGTIGYTSLVLRYVEEKVTIIVINNISHNLNVVAEELSRIVLNEE